GGSVVGEVTGGTQDAVLEKPGIGADREQAQVVIGFRTSASASRARVRRSSVTPPRSVAINILPPLSDTTKPTGSAASCGTGNASTCTPPTRNGTPVTKRSVETPVSRSPAAARVPALARTGAP